jgi:hypothetical protein
VLINLILLLLLLLLLFPNFSNYFNYIISFQNVIVIIISFGILNDILLNCGDILVLNDVFLQDKQFPFTFT